MAIQSPLRCPSCGSAIARDELEHFGCEWASRQSFADWWVIPDMVDELASAKFCGFHESFAAGCLCPSCKQPFTYPEEDGAFADPFVDQDPFGEVPW